MRICNIGTVGLLAVFQRRDTSGHAVDSIRVIVIGATCVIFSIFLVVCLTWIAIGIYGAVSVIEGRAIGYFEDRK